MRTAGKRRKALWARRIRPQGSRFVPVLMDRSPPAWRPAPRRALPFALSVSKQALCGDFQEPLPAACQPGHLQKIFFHSLWAFSCPAYAPPAMTLQEKSSGHQQTCFPFPSGYGGPPPRIEPVSPSYPLVKQRGAAPPSSSRQAPSWAEAPAPTTASTKRPPSPAPQKNASPILASSKTSSAARPAMEPREGPHTLRDLWVWSMNGIRSSAGDRRARKVHRPPTPLH